MHLTLRSRCVRGAAAGALSAALLSAGTAGAVAATDPSPMPTRTHTAMPTKAAEAITVRASHSSIKSGQSVTLTGRTANLAAGAKLTVQHWVNGKWTTLRATSVVKKGDTYTVSTKLLAKGPQKLRVVHGTAHSKTVTVDVT
ncbi:hypothetical protein ACFYNZ_00610 [Streptomyces kebangsaanensis]|uniref:Bacterial Ig domain-containing protein n=1 Tax=Streptomyces kebangsaanensis TaxID=864058 RepID=A0ABW6KJF1_9ACTN